MTPMKKQRYSTAGSLKGRSLVANCSLKHLSKFSSSVLRGFSSSEHGGHQKVHTVSSHVSKDNRHVSLLSRPGSTNISNFVSSTKIHQGGSHFKRSNKIRNAPASKSLDGNHIVSLSKVSNYNAISFSKNPSKGHKSLQIHSTHFGNVGDHSNWKNSGLFNINEKETMQILNCRLSSYLEKITSLQQKNAQLEKNIGEWYEANAPSTFPDASKYFRVISDLQNKISETTLENTSIFLEIENAKLAADDFRNKYEMEFQLSNGAVADVYNLRNLLQGLNRERCDLEREVQNLQEELQQIKTNHEEEASSLRSHLGSRVNVELNAPPPVDLNKVLAKIRIQYENLTENNLREVENMFTLTNEKRHQEVASSRGAGQLQSEQTKVVEIKRTENILEIELQSQLNITSVLKQSLAEAQATYGTQIDHLQSLINNVESQLAQIRTDLGCQNHKYKILMNQKTHLEMEIAAYKRLLEGHDIQVTGYHNTSGKHGPQNTMVQTADHGHEKC